MAHVTRCPYCNSIWLLPNRQIAEDGPLKCSNCNHSFDASRDILELPDELFPDFIPDENTTRPMRVTQINIDAPAEKPAPVPDVPKMQMKNLNHLFDDFDGANEPTLKNLPAATPEPVGPAKTEPIPAVPDKKPAIPHIVPSSVFPVENDKRILIAQNKKKSGSWGSTLALFVLFAWLLAALAVVFNQKVMEEFPETKEVYAEVCSRISCPGYYFKNINAFVVTQTKLVALGDPGNYNLETVIVNSSDSAQAIPHLALTLTNEEGKPLMNRNLSPAEFIPGETAKSLSAGRALNVRIKLQTNVTPSRCSVSPFYP